MDDERKSDAGNQVNFDRRRAVRKVEKNAWNRLMSIQYDAAWVLQVRRAHLPDLPVVPNLRCGAWYVPEAALANDSVVKGCYFKSTDGHTNEWSFSLKRHNLALLSLIVDQGGCIVVDSTRRGKSMPDALSKTIPIWCAVLNAASASKHASPSKDAHNDEMRLRVPVQTVSPSEKARIEAHIQDWTEDLLESDLQIPRLTKPLRPLFVTPARMDEELTRCKEADVNYYPVILVSASPMVATPDLTPRLNARQIDWEGLSKTVGMPELAALYNQSPFIYVQGSGDDEEMWSDKLTPKMLWDSNNLRSILETKGDIEALKVCVDAIVAQSSFDCMNLIDVDSSMSKDIRIAPFDIWFGRRTPSQNFSSLDLRKYKLIVHADGASPLATEEEEESNCKIMRLGIEHGKRGLHPFRRAIRNVLAEARSALPSPILLCSAEEDGIGHDLNAGFAICILATLFDADQKMLLCDKVKDDAPLIPPELTKEDVHRRLQWITTYVPQTKPPSRKHMLRINDALLSADYHTGQAEKD